jgi:hypothetical protein
MEVLVPPRDWTVWPPASVCTNDQLRKAVSVSRKQLLANPAAVRLPCSVRV